MPFVLYTTRGCGLWYLGNGGCRDGFDHAGCWIGGSIPGAGVSRGQRGKGLCVGEALVVVESASILESCHAVCWRPILLSDGVNKRMQGSAVPVE